MYITDKIKIMKDNPRLRDPMKDKLTTAWAYVVAALIYGLFIYTAFAYFGEIVLWLQEAVNG